MRYTELKTLNHARQWCHQNQVTIKQAALPPHIWGGYSHATRTIYIKKNLTTAQKLPTLLHEIHHAARGDSGHQTRQIENRINHHIAATLINPAQYAEAEKLHGPHIGALADSLNVPVWLIEAFQNAIKRGKL